MPSVIPQSSSSVRGVSLSSSGTRLAVLRHDSLAVHNINPSTNVLEASDITASLDVSSGVLDVVWSSPSDNETDFVLYTGGGNGVVGWAVGTNDKLEQVWAAGDVKEEGVGCVGVGGSRVVAGGKDGVVRVWDCGGGRGVVRELKGHRLGVRGVDVQGKGIGSGRGDIVVSGGRDGSVRVWDLRVAEKGGEVCYWRGHKGWCHGVAIGSGDAIVSCGGDKTVRLWRIGVGDERVMRGHEYRVWGVAMDERGTVAVSGSTDATLRVWELEGLAKAVGEEHRDSVVAVDVSRDGNIAVSGCEDGEVRFWNVPEMLGRCGSSDIKGKELEKDLLIDERSTKEVPVDDLLGLDDDVSSTARPLQQRTPLDQENLLKIVDVVETRDGESDDTKLFQAKSEDGTRNEVPGQEDINTSTSIEHLPETSGLVRMVPAVNDDNIPVSERPVAEKKVRETSITGQSDNSNLNTEHVSSDSQPQRMAGSMEAVDLQVGNASETEVNPNVIRGPNSSEFRENGVLSKEVTKVVGDRQAEHLTDTSRIEKSSRLPFLGDEDLCTVDASKETLKPTPTIQTSGSVQVDEDAAAQGGTESGGRNVSEDSVEIEEAAKSGLESGTGDQKAGLKHLEQEIVSKLGEARTRIEALARRLDFLIAQE